MYVGQVFVQSGNKVIINSFFDVFIERLSVRRLLFRILTSLLKVAFPEDGVCHEVAHALRVNSIATHHAHFACNVLSRVLNCQGLVAIVNTVLQQTIFNFFVHFFANVNLRRRVFVHPAQHLILKVVVPLLNGPKGVFVGLNGHILFWHRLRLKEAVQIFQVLINKGRFFPLLPE